MCTGNNQEIKFNPNCLELGCSECCGLVPIEKTLFVRQGLRKFFAGDKKEVLTIEGSLVDTKTGKKKKIIISTRTVDGLNKCAFLNDENKCNIYDKRPEICRDFGTELSLKEPHLICPILNPNNAELDMLFEQTEKALAQLGIKVSKKTSQNSNLIRKVVCNGCEKEEVLIKTNEERLIFIDKDCKLVNTEAEGVGGSFYLCQECFDAWIECYTNTNNLYHSNYMKDYIVDNKHSDKDFIHMVMVEQFDQWFDLANGFKDSVCSAIKEGEL